MGVAALLVLAILIASPRARERAAAGLLTGTAAATPERAGTGPTAQAGIRHALVSRVIDGATVELEDGQRVRYLGVRSPAVGSADGTSAAEFYGVEAREANRALVEGKQVALEADEVDRDAAGRLLRYVWVDQSFVNVALVRGGYARTDPSQPAVKYGDLLRSVEEEARETRRGIWTQAGALTVDTANPPVLTTRSLPTPRPTAGGASPTPFVCTAAEPTALPPDQAVQHVGEQNQVVFQVVRTYNSGRAVFLNSHDPYEGYFYVVVFPELWDRFPDPPEEYFAGRCVAVQGKIDLYRGAPQIVLSDPEQIKVVR